MKTPTEFYKKLLAYDDKLNLDEAAPLTHKGVIHFITEYANQFCKPDVMQSLPSDEEIKNQSYEIYPINKDLTRNSARNGWVRGMMEMRDIVIKRGNGA